ncbi:MAG: hypothetical protein GX478_05980 [Erysipelotrichaceae bacterium]|nr:hypothetical protein [Erysipelotrichaceae bacterium]
MIKVGKKGLTKIIELTSKRVYKAAYSCDQAYHMIMNGECGAFSQLMLKCLEQELPELKAVKAKNEDAS